MDIKIPAPAAVLTTAIPSIDQIPLNQALDTTVLDSDSDRLTMTLQIAKLVLQVRSDRPLSVLAGQQMSVVLTQRQPVAQFTVLTLPQDAGASAQSATGSSPAHTDTTTPAILLQQSKPQAGITHKLAADLLPQLLKGQQVQLIITAVSGEKISAMASIVTASSNLASSAPVPVTLQVKQLNPPIAADRQNVSTYLAEQTGQTVRLEVVKPGQMPQFNLIPDVGGSKPLSIEQTIAETYKRLLPAQQSASAFINQLRNVLTASDNGTPISDTLKQLALDILRMLPRSPQQLDAETLKRQLADSGRFLEARLVRASATSNPGLLIQEDFKLKLLKLISHLQANSDAGAEQNSADTEQNLLLELRQKTHGVLSKIILDQLSSLPREESGKQTWSLELPFFQHDHADIGQVTLSIEQDQAEKTEKPHRGWTVNMILTPPNLGTIHCKINSFDKIVSTRFWSENSATVAKINRHLDQLQQHLAEQGIRLGVMEVQHGKPQMNMPTAAMRGKNLINEKA